MIQHNMKYMVSVDFGQTVDHTAVAVTKRRLEPKGEKYNYQGLAWEGDLHHGGNVPFKVVRQDVEQHYDLIRLDRVALHTSYVTIARGIVKLVQELNSLHRGEEDLMGRLRQRIPVGLAIDEGGVGKAIKDILREAILQNIPDGDGQPSVVFLPVTVHGGANTSHSGGYWHIPKRDLIHSGIVAYQNETLKVGKLRHRDVLEKELQNYRLKQNISTSHVSFEPLREGEHDDLLFAVCLGVWAWERVIERVEYKSFPGEWIADAPVMVVG